MSNELRIKKWINKKYIVFIQLKNTYRILLLISTKSWQFINFRSRETIRWNHTTFTLAKWCYHPYFWWAQFSLWENWSTGSIHVSGIRKLLSMFGWYVDIVWFPNRMISCSLWYRLLWEVLRCMFLWEILFFCSILPLLLYLWRAKNHVLLGDCCFMSITVFDVSICWIHIQ